MKKILKLLTSIIVLVIVIVAIMFFAKICPPVGPWPSPPWCANNSFEAKYFDTEYNAQKLNKIKAVNMSDTWGRNYNFAMIESTRNNIASSFARVAELGAEEVYVHDFHRAIYEDDNDFKSTQYSIEDEIFWNDMRDESMTAEDVNKLAKAAHDNNLKLGIKHNMAFVNIGKYIKEAGNIAGSVEEDYEAFNSGHSEEWIRDYFSKWQERLVSRAKLYQSAGVDIMSITPTWMGPTFNEHEELVNQLNKDLIAELRKVFKGEIHVEVSRYGFIDGNDGEEDWSKYDYYQDADIVQFNIYKLRDKYAVEDNPSKDQIKQGFDRYLSDINETAKDKNIKVSILLTAFSYDNAINEGIVEYLDIVSDEAKAIKADYDHQADIYQAFFESVKDMENIERVMVNGYWWDDAMDPQIKVKVSVSPSTRNKPADAVIKKWFSQE